MLTAPAAAAVRDDPTPVHESSPSHAPARPLVAAAVAAGLVGVLVAQQTIAPADPPSAGFSARGDGARTGRVAAAAPTPPTLPAWDLEVALGATRPDGTQLLVDDDRVAVVLRDRRAPRVVVHDRTDGAVTWVAEGTPGAGALPPVLHGERLLLRRFDGAELLDVAAREVVWTEPASPLGREAVGTDVGIATWSGGGSGLWVHSWADGDRRWGWTTSDRQVVTDVAVRGSLAVVVTAFGRSATVRLLDLAAERVRWEVDLPTIPEPAVGPLPLVTLDATQALVVDSQRELRLDLATGEVVTSRTAGTSFPVDVALVDGAAVVATGLGTVAGRGPRGPGWSQPDVLSGAPPADVLDVTATDGVAVVRRDDGILLHDPSTGRVLLRVPTPEDAPSAVAPDGTVVTLDGQGVLALAGRGGQQWRAPTALRPHPDVVADGGLAAVATRSGVVAVDVARGAVLWTQDAFDPALVAPGAVTGPALAGGLVVAAPPGTLAPDRGGLVGLRADTGIVAWARSEDVLPPRGELSVDRDVVLTGVAAQVHGYDVRTGRRALVTDAVLPRGPVAAGGGWLAAAELRDGGSGDVWVGRRTDRRTSFRAPEPACAAPTLHDGRVLFPTAAGAVIARDLATGAQPWGRLLGGDVCAPLTLVDGHVVVVRNGTDLLALGASDGEERWRVTVPGGLAAPPTAAGDVLLVPGLDGTVRAWRVGEAAPRWTVEVDGTPATSVAVDGDRVLVLLRDGRLRALS